MRILNAVTHPKSLHILCKLVLNKVFNHAKLKVPKLNFIFLVVLEGRFDIVIEISLLNYLFDTVKDN